MATPATITDRVCRARFEAALAAAAKDGRIVMRSASGWPAEFWASPLGNLWTSAGPCQACAQYGDPASEPCATCGAWCFGLYRNPAAGRNFPSPETCEHGLLLAIDCGG